MPYTKYRKEYNLGEFCLFLKPAGTILTILCKELRNTLIERVVEIRKNQDIIASDPLRRMMSKTNSHAKVENRLILAPMQDCR